jgi:predicted nucleotidyltransferase
MSWLNQNGMRKALLNLGIEDASIVVSGSLARDEFAESGDVHWTVRVEAKPETLAEENAKLLLGLCPYGKDIQTIGSTVR